ncbi:glycosyltransferase family 2 protein [Shewanella sp. 10N.7]|uniref:glycosyltransferase family 2 protein n=1 Tax=Shewanella sp. 10N.7 TaxID=2885093 RepID=UPI001E3D1D4A|nr:glycosyltransferase family 2 protein [Shewanella sp. 10N.7]MCC4831105.1 glycosyltransferase family 2 protein [Shewanella sp. 10N.7]
MDSTDFSNVLVSIIVPAFNVEKFISKCIESLLCQDYNNIEVIVVNDGSTDKTPDLLSKLCKANSIVRVIHTENQGVSSARNIGIKESKGVYLVFVDGDDYLETDFVSYMLNLVESTGCDFCLSTECYTNKYEKQSVSSSIKTLNSDDSTALLLSPDVVVGCWNKIFKRSFLVSNGISFSTSLFYGEGLTFITQVSQLSISVGVGNRKVYNYRRNNEESATTEFNIEKVYNGEIALLAIKDSIKNESKKIDLMFNYHLSLYRLGALVRIKSSQKGDIYSEDYKRWLDYIRKSTISNLFYWEVSAYRKLLMTSGCISPSLLSSLDKVRRRRIMKNSVNGQ